MCADVLNPRTYYDIIISYDARIFVNGKEAKPGKDIKPGDEITIAFGRSEMKVRVLSTPDHVGKDDAASLYEVLS